MAHLSGDQGLISAFKDGLDIHKTTASEIFQLSLDKVTEDHRRKAKAINFGLIYGMSAFGLSKQLSILRTEAQDYIDSYFARYPGVLAYMERIKSEAAENGMSRLCMDVVYTYRRFDLRTSIGVRPLNGQQSTHRCKEQRQTS